MAAVDLTIIFQEFFKADQEASRERREATRARRRMVALARQHLGQQSKTSRQLKSREQNIINAIGRGNSVKGTTIARALGVEYVHSFQGDLAKMKREGKLVNNGRGDGYAVAEEWQDCIQDDPENDLPKTA